MWILVTFQPFIFKEERLHSVDVTGNMKIIFLVKCLYIVVTGSLRKTLQQMNTKKMKDEYKRCMHFSFNNWKLKIKTIDCFKQKSMTIKKKRLITWYR